MHGPADETSPPSILMYVPDDDVQTSQDPRQVRVCVRAGVRSCVRLWLATTMCRHRRLHGWTAVCLRRRYSDRSRRWKKSLSDQSSV